MPVTSNLLRPLLFHVPLQGPDLQRILRVTYELLIISGNYDKVTTNLQFTINLMTNLRQRQMCLKKSNIIVANRNKLFDAKLPYWFSLLGIPKSAFEN